MDKNDNGLMMPSINEMEKLSKAFIEGYDTIGNKEFFTIPSQIVSETANLRKLEKPFEMIVDNTKSPTIKSYYENLHWDLQAFVNNVHYKDIEYNIYMILHKYYSKILSDIINIFKNQKIKYNESDIQKIVDQLMINTETNRIIMQRTIDIPTLDRIEQMLQLELLNMEANGDKLNKIKEIENMSVFRTIMAPYVQKICIETVYSMYNFAVEELYKYTLRNTAITGNKYNLEDLEDELLKTFADIHDDFSEKLFLLIGNLVMVRTHQNLIPEADIFIDE